jgi:hypothetical protein
MSRETVALMRVIGKALRAEYEDIKLQPLPPLWVDLICRVENARAYRPEGSPGFVVRNR